MESLSLQGNEFTDAGVSYLKNSLKLKTLWIGSERSTLTDRACFEFANHTNLESLGLGHALITDRGIKQLKSLKKLKMLNLGGTDDDAEEGITDESAEVISGFEHLHFLFIGNCRFTENAVRKLAEMKNMQKIHLGGTPIPPEISQKFNDKHPDGWSYRSASNSQE